MSGSKIWQSYGKRLVASSLFHGMAFQAMGELMLRNEKSREGWMSRTITCHFPYKELLQLKEWYSMTMEEIDLHS
jgi:hypothetical protein